MKKKLLVLFISLALILALGIVAIAADGEEAEKEITISYVNHHNPFNPTTSLDTTAYENGKQVVKAGEEFTLPTTSSAGYNEPGYQLRWYTSDGRSYKGGETVSFTEDTKLFRVAAKEVYSFDNLKLAMTSNSHAAILMNDIYTEDDSVSVWDQNHAILDLGGHELSISKNGSVMGGHRSASIVIGKGIFKVSNPDGKVGSYNVFNAKGHSHNGDETEILIGRDVTIDAPNFCLAKDEEGNHIAGFPYIKICGTLNVQYILARTSGANAAKIEFTESCNVTLTAKYFNLDYKAPTDTVIYNRHSFNIIIHGGVFRLPAEAANEVYWSTDNYATEDQPTYATQDEIVILGGTFILPDGAKPGIDNFLDNSYVLAVDDRHEGINLSGIMNGNGDATAYVNFLVPGAYKFAFNRNGSVVITDNLGTGKGGTYYYTINKTADGTAIETISLFTDKEKTNPTDIFEIKQGKNTITLMISFDELKESLTTNTTTLLTTGVTAVVATNNCEHSYEPISSTPASCIVYATQTYKCSGCEDTYTVPYGGYAECVWELANDVPPTPISVGVKTFVCTVCGEVKEELYYLDIANEYITVVVTGGVEVSVKVSDLYALASLGDNQYKVTDIKAFGDYAITDIIEINIPVGIAEINFESNNSSVVKLNILDDTSLKVTSFAKLTALTEINIGAATVTFQKGCINSVIAEIHSDVEGANVTFGDDLFYKKSHIKELTLSAGSTYAFGQQSFRESGLTEIIFPDNSTISLGNTAFAECQKLEYIYFGSNIGVKKLINGAAIFDGISSLKKVVIMDLTYLGQWAFSTKEPGKTYGPVCDLTVYIHSEALTMSEDAFNNRTGSYNVYIYTVQAKFPSKINNCNYTFYTGVPHALFEANEAPTCTEDGVNGYKTDCPCGAAAIGTIVVKKYALKSLSEFEEITYVSESVPATGHNALGAIVGASYESFLEKGDYTYICSACGEENTVEGTAPELFDFLGYSTNKDHTELTIGYSVNVEAIEIYERVTGNTVAYGVVGAITSTLDGKAPLEAAKDGATIIDALIEERCPSFDFIVKGFDEETLDLGMTMSAYVTETNALGESTTVYIQDEQTDVPSSYTLGECVAALPNNEQEAA